MIPQRSIEEGAAMEKGKTNPDYFEACSTCEMNPEDMKRLGIWKNTNVRVTSECGSVIVKAIEPTQYCSPGLVHIRQGVWANQIVPPRTQSTGTPQYSGFPVTLEPAMNEMLKTALELVQRCPNLSPA
ncbi:MAG: formylmethanofuran dehydrogenase subunit D [Methanoregula sp. SKADARSKE-2]|nr:MAG: formylmethanofuran dehydrogenase subunit D [Methanoregula sp. SKADARSKE-2]